MSVYLFLLLLEPIISLSVLLLHCKQVQWFSVRFKHMDMFSVSTKAWHGSCWAEIKYVTLLLSIFFCCVQNSWVSCLYVLNFPDIYFHDIHSFPYYYHVCNPPSEPAPLLPSFETEGWTERKCRGDCFVLSVIVTVLVFSSLSSSVCMCMYCRAIVQRTTVWLPSSQPRDELPPVDWRSGYLWVPLHIMGGLKEVVTLSQLNWMRL